MTRSHTERRFDHAFTEWVKEQTHANPSDSDEAILADLRLRLDAKLASTFRATFSVMGGAG